MPQVLLVSYNHLDESEKHNSHSHQQLVLHEYTYKYTAVKYMQYVSTHLMIFHNVIQHQYNCMCGIDVIFTRKIQDAYKQQDHVHSDSYETLTRA